MVVKMKITIEIDEFFNVPISYFLESEEEDYERSNDCTGNSITD